MKNAVEAGSDAIIELTAGTYGVTSTLRISRDVTITAADGATVVLDGQNARQVIYISAGTVQLVGLIITEGYAYYVCKHSRESFVESTLPCIELSELVATVASHTKAPFPLFVLCLCCYFALQ